VEGTSPAISAKDNTGRPTQPLDTCANTGGSTRLLYAELKNYLKFIYNPAVCSRQKTDLRYFKTSKTAKQKRYTTHPRSRY
jgi:hypothetical protein